MTLEGGMDMQPNPDRLPDSKHFVLHRLADGVYATIAKPDGLAYSNAGIIDLGDQVIIFDTFESVLAAQDLHTASKLLTGRRPDWVVISHAHPDHWMGNQVFADHAAILSTHATRELMPEFVADILNLKDDPSELYIQVRAFEEQLRAESEPVKRRVLETAIRRQRSEIEMLPSLEICYPSHTFEGKLVFHGTHRSAELITNGQGHTLSDAYLVLPQEKIAFIGDLGFFACQPYMSYIDPPAWTRQLEGFQASDIDLFVPGHGPLGEKADLRSLCDYILILEGKVADVIRRGGDLDEALQITLPEPFAAWIPAGRRRFEANLRSAYDRQTAV
jgi:cyclase